jgi:cytochrome P450
VLREAILDRRANPTDDLTSAVANGVVQGKPVSVEDRSLLPTAIEEFLRMFPASTFAARSATRDLEIGSRHIKEREPVGLSILSANRDETVFDSPDEVRIDRTPNPHLSFGAGIHRCIGLHYARFELTVMLDRILTTMPDMRLDLEHEDVPNQHLFATFTPRTKAAVQARPA